MERVWLSTFCFYAWHARNCLLFWLILFVEDHKMISAVLPKKAHRVEICHGNQKSRNIFGFHNFRLKWFHRKICHFFAIDVLEAEEGRGSKAEMGLRRNQLDERACCARRTETNTIGTNLIDRFPCWKWGVKKICTNLSLQQRPYLHLRLSATVTGHRKIHISTDTSLFIIGPAHLGSCRSLPSSRPTPFLFPLRSPYLPQSRLLSLFFPGWLSLSSLPIPCVSLFRSSTSCHQWQRLAAVDPFHSKSKGDKTKNAKYKKKLSSMSPNTPPNASIIMGSMMLLVVPRISSNACKIYASCVHEFLLFRFFFYFRSCFFFIHFLPLSLSLSHSLSLFVLLLFLSMNVKLFVQLSICVAGWVLWSASATNYWRFFFYHFPWLIKPICLPSDKQHSREKKVEIHKKSTQRPTNVTSSGWSFPVWLARPTFFDYLQFFVSAITNSLGFESRNPGTERKNLPKNRAFSYMRRLE